MVGLWDGRRIGACRLLFVLVAYQGVNLANKAVKRCRGANQKPLPEKGIFKCCVGLRFVLFSIVKFPYGSTSD